MSSHPLLTGLEEVRRNWGWFLVLGIALIVLGVVALAMPHVATDITILTFGWLLIIGGAFEAVAAIEARRWSGFFLHLLGGVLYVVVGILLVANPGAGALTLTLLLAALYLVEGVFQVVGAVALRFPNWGWAVFGGLITALVGALIWAQWPSSAVWVIGLFVGIDLIFRGWAWVTLALAAHHLPLISDPLGRPDVGLGQPSPV
jgi:uncharacterized membrane protein HdeD (DUF308 family)